MAPSVVTATDCPGAVGRNCTRQCQLRICKALVDFYRVANNASDPWDEEEGWVDSETQSCEQLLSRPGPQGLPAYCRWHGVQCCDAAHAADEQCYLLGSVRGVNQAMNNVNVSLSDPTLLRSLKTLHACGLTIFDVESNNVAGSLTEEWGQLRHLQYLNIGGCTTGPAWHVAAVVHLQQHGCSQLACLRSGHPCAISTTTWPPVCSPCALPLVALTSSPPSCQLQVMPISHHVGQLLIHIMIGSCSIRTSVLIVCCCVSPAL